jgi:hypothetical protein
MVDEKILFEQEKTKLLNKGHYVKNKTEIMQDILEMQEDKVPRPSMLSDK